MSKKVLEVLFPGEDVAIGGGRVVKVTPLMLEDLPKVIGAFAQLMKLAQENASPAELAISGFDELLKILPYCLSLPLIEIPVVAFPDIIEVVLNQNVTEASVGKWKALLQRASAHLPNVKAAALAMEQSPASKK